MSLIEQIKESIIKGHSEASSPFPPDMAGQPGVKELVQKAIDEGIEIDSVVNDGMIAGMEIVGDRFTAGEIYVPEMLISAQAMKAGMALLEPLLAEKKTSKKGTFIIGTVQGDMHDIGKNLVGIMLEGGGYEVVDLGIDAAPSKFIDAAQKYPKAVIGMSALLTTTMENMRLTINALRESGCNNKVIIGGAAVSQKFSDDIGADGYAREAPQAVPLVKQLSLAG